MEQLPDAWAYGVLAVVLVIASICDVRTGKIYNWTTYPAVIVGLSGHALFGGWAGNEDTMGLMHSLLGLAGGFLPLFLAFRLGGIGGGDAKIMAAVGALSGLRFTVSAMFYGFAVAAVMAVIITLRKRVFRRTMGRVWRFALMVLTPRVKPIDPATPDSPKLPFGLALCIGSGIALVEMLIRGKESLNIFGF